MPFDMQAWSEAWSLLVMPLAVPLAIWAWFVADGANQEDVTTTDYAEFTDF
jgi:hypothetical protein